MKEHEEVVRRFYEARDRRDWDGVRELLAPDVVWTEGASTTDYAGAHRGRETVAELLAKFVAITSDTFRLAPKELISTSEHVAAAVRWRAERGGIQVEGNDLAVYRVNGGRIAAAWFFADGYDEKALLQVFSFSESP